MSDEREIDDAVREAQVLIAGVYGEISRLKKRGKTATAIVVPPHSYRQLQGYRAQLGEVREGLPDYLGQYDLFGIPLYTDGGDKIVIRSKREDPLL